MVRKQQPRPLRRSGCLTGAGTPVERINCTVSLARFASAVKGETKPHTSFQNHRDWCQISKRYRCVKSDEERSASASEITPIVRSIPELVSLSSHLWLCQWWRILKAEEHEATSVPQVTGRMVVANGYVHMKNRPVRASQTTDCGGTVQR